MKNKKNTSQLIQAMRAENNYTYTENAAVTHKSTLNDVLDYYSLAGAMRGRDTTLLFANAYSHDPVLAIKTLFYLRDIRGGSKIGERETFRQGLRYLNTHRRDVFNALVPLVAEYGRWDDIVEFVDNPVVVQLVRMQFNQDKESVYFTNKSISLLGKWMPSANTSSKKTRELARKWIAAFGTRESVYRRALSMLRDRINIVERLMSAGDFSSINYAQVPSNASLRYRKAFSKRDATRYVQYLEDVKAGKKTINASTLYPYEIVGKYLDGHSYDETMELLWKALEDYTESNANAMVVADVSGSMRGQPMNVSIALAIYFAERNTGAFKNYFMTFSNEGRLIGLRGNTLHEKVRNVASTSDSWNQNTNIQAAFDSILTVAVKNRIPVSEMPALLFIISDMEFDSADSRRTNFEVIRRKYDAAGYPMPKLVFWNVDARNNQSPVTEKQEGVYLVSGLSAGIFASALKAKATTPVDMMLETLSDARYDRISEALTTVRL